MPLYPIAEAGSGGVQVKETARLREIIEKINDLFDGELSDDDKLIYVNNVIKGRLIESKRLQHTRSTTKQKFAGSPDLKSELMNAIIGALEGRSVTSSQALGSEAVRYGPQDVRLNHAQLYESLCAVRS